MINYVDSSNVTKAYFHLPGLFEFYEFYKVFLPIFHNHREYFYDFCEIGSIYGAPSDCIWGGGRVGFGENDPIEVYKLMREYNISARLTFSNSLLCEEHLLDKKCNYLCRLFSTGLSTKDDIHGADSENEEIDCESVHVKNGVIIYSDLLLNYIRKKYPDFYFVSSTTKVITDFYQFENELNRNDFSYVVPDFRLNKRFDRLENLSSELKNKVEFLVNECCSFTCTDRKSCYENVSKKALMIDCEDHICKSPHAHEGYVFSRAMKNPGFIGLNDIRDTYMKMGFSNFKIEGRSLGSAILLEFLLYYMTKPEYHLRVRELIYLDSSLDLF